MSIEGELARAGIVTLDDETIITKDMVVAQDLNVEDNLIVGGDSTIDGDLFVSGDLTGTVIGTYYLQFRTFVVSGANDIYLVVPTGGDGNITAIKVVATVALTSADADITLNANGDASDASITFTQTTLAAIGSVESIAVASTATHIDVVAGEYIKLTSDGGPDAGEVDGIIEITRT